MLRSSGIESIPPYVSLHSGDDRSTQARKSLDKFIWMYDQINRSCALRGCVADAAAKIGALSIRFGLVWAKSHSFHTGQTPVMKYNRTLKQVIMWGGINIGEVVGVQMISLKQAPQGCGEFDPSVPKKFVIDPHKAFS